MEPEPRGRPRRGRTIRRFIASGVGALAVLGATMYMSAGTQAQAPVVAAGDPEAGAAVAEQCAGCHTLEEGGAAGFGPNLFGIVGRLVGGVDGFTYSDPFVALNAEGETWTTEFLDAFLTNPAEAVPGNRMPFGGIADDTARADLIAYLATLTGAVGDAAAVEEAAPIEVAAAVEPEQYDETSIRLGFQVWKNKVWCGQCHGWSGNGLPDDPRAPVGASMRDTLLTPELLYEAIKCGRIGTEMPAFDARAYLDDRCYGLTAEQLGPDTPPAHGVYLIPRELNGLVAYIFTTMVGQGPFTDADCRAYYGEDAAICETIRAGGVAQPALADPP